MGKSWLVCVLLGTLAWGQTQPQTQTGTTPPAAAAAPAATRAPGAASKPATPAAPPEVAENAVVLTITGVCPAAEKTTTPAKGGAGKTAAAKKPADCKTEITRAEFEKIANGLSPNVTPQLKRQLETALPRFMALSEAAKAKGLDKSPRYLETLRVAKMQILTQELQRSVQDEADKVSQADIEAYYKKNPEAYEQYSLDRLFVPKYKTVEAEDKDDKDKDAKDKDDAKEPELTEEQQKAKQAEEQAKRDKGAEELTKLADSLHEQAVAGGDFAKLQKDAFAASGTKVDSPTVNLPKVRRTGLPPAHAEVFDLKVGEVSKVISDNGGHYVYKVVSKQLLPLDDQLSSEIHNKLKSERLKDMMDKYNNSFQSTPNEAYFGPAAAAGPGGRAPGQLPPHMRSQMPAPAAPPQAQPQSAPPASNAPAQPAPPSKPN